MVLKISSLFMFSLITIVNAQPYSIDVSNGGKWGDWGSIEWCPRGYLANGFSIKLEDKQGGRDDTAVNGIRLHCIDRHQGNMGHTITSSQGIWGTWTSPLWCTNSYLTSFMLKVEGQQGLGDDTAVNNIKFKCSNNHELEETGLPWGNYGKWSEMCHYGICGIQTKVEKQQGTGDDTALNNVKLYCCN